MDSHVAEEFARIVSSCACGQGLSMTAQNPVQSGFRIIPSFLASLVHFGGQLGVNWGSFDLQGLLVGHVDCLPDCGRRG